LQVSVPLQALPSPQMTGVPDTQAPVAGLQVSVPLQALPSPQMTGVPDTQAPVARSQVSVPLQAPPSPQASLARRRQPVPVRPRSSQQGFAFALGRVYG